MSGPFTCGLINAAAAVCWVASSLIKTSEAFRAFYSCRPRTTPTKSAMGIRKVHRGHTARPAAKVTCKWRVVFDERRSQVCYRQRQLRKRWSQRARGEWRSGAGQSPASAKVVSGLTIPDIGHTKLEYFFVAFLSEKEPSYLHLWT